MPARKRKVSKNGRRGSCVDGIYQRIVNQSREKHDQMQAKEESKKLKTELVPSKEKPKETKFASTSVIPSIGQSSCRKGVLKKREKPKQTSIAISLVSSKIESDEEEEKAKKMENL